MDDVDLQLNFKICFDHFQHRELAKDDFKTPGGSKDNSPNDSESIEVVETTPSNPFKGPLHESTLSSASNNTDCVVLENYANDDDLHFLPDDDDLESDVDEVFIRENSDDNEDFTLLRKPAKKSRRICKCEESINEDITLSSSENALKQPTYSGTDSDVEVLMSEEVVEKSIAAFDNEGDDGGKNGCVVKNESLADKGCDRDHLLKIIQQQECRIKALEDTLERYHRAQQRLFEHVDALRLELSEMRIADPISAVNENKNSCLE